MLNVRLNLNKVTHGFIKGRNVITAAKQHVGFKATIMLDLKDFFDTVHISMFHPKLRDPLLFRETGYCAQGFVTSPMLSNIAFIKTLRAIKTRLNKVEPDHAITMYADDIQISLQTEDSKRIQKVTSIVKEEVERSNFILNEKKTRVKYAKYGYRRILGINVGDTSYRATRKVMRKIRAARHQGERSSLGGLVNWSRCAEPRQN